MLCIMDVTWEHDMAHLTHRPIVVAVDGSPASTEALRWIKTYHLAEPGQLRVLTAYQYPYLASDIPLPTIDLDDIAESAREAAQCSIRAVFGNDRSAPEIEHIVEFGSIDALIERHGDDAQFVVVGSRARHRLRDRLRPSTTNRVTGRVACPVVSVPESTMAAASRGAETRLDHAD
jgi:nucleotide-binding universal stress UspA family protein